MDVVRDGDASLDAMGPRNKVNIVMMASVGRDEMGASALRRRLSTRMDSSNDLISASIACNWCSREFA